MECRGDGGGYVQSTVVANGQKRLLLILLTACRTAYCDVAAATQCPCACDASLPPLVTEAPALPTSARHARRRMTHLRLEAAATCGWEPAPSGRHHWCLMTPTDVGLMMGGHPAARGSLPAVFSILVPAFGRRVLEGFCQVRGAGSSRKGRGVRSGQRKAQHDQPLVRGELGAGVVWRSASATSQMGYMIYLQGAFGGHTDLRRLPADQQPAAIVNS